MYCVAGTTITPTAHALLLSWNCFWRRLLCLFLYGCLVTYVGVARLKNKCHGSRVLVLALEAYGLERYTSGGHALLFTALVLPWPLDRHLSQQAW
jgi:hypothetical protein